MTDYKNAMSQIVENGIANGQLVGANVLMIKDDEEIYFRSHGYADKEKNIPMKRDSIFRMYSMTKPITAAVTMILAERGKIDLLDPVYKFIPEFADCKVYDGNGELVSPKRPINIWDLLTMTSGITYPDLECVPGKQMDDLFKNIKEKLANGIHTNTLDYCRQIAGVPLCFHPGEGWKYGLSADILGGIIEVASGRTLGSFMKEEIFDPLGMKNTGFVLPKENRNRLATAYQWSDDEGKLIPYTDNHLGLEGYGDDVTFESGGAGLVSTIDDYSKFAKMMLHHGTFEGKKILGKKTIELMSSGHLTDEQKVDFNWDNLRGYDYGFLTRVMQNPGMAGSNASVGEFGWDGWMGTYITMDPSENMALLYFIQRTDAGTTEEIRKLRMAAYAML